MAGDSGDARRWVVDPPPQPGEISIHMACGDGIDLNPEQEAALGALLRSLEAGDAEVVGHSKGCPKLSECLGLSCTKMSCNPLQCSSLDRSIASTGTGGWNLMGTFGTSA